MTRPGFPYGLTVAAAFVFALCIGLGQWQVRRFQWKQRVLAQIAALASAPPQPIGAVLSQAAAGREVEFTRVRAQCLAAAPAPARVAITTDKGDWITRVFGDCRLAAGPFDGIVADRGLVEASRGQLAPVETMLPSLGQVVGVLRREAGPPRAGLRRPAPYLLVVEQESPPPPGIIPSRWAGAAPANLQYVGEYAPTWFGLAGVLAAFYAALLWRKVRSPR